jgi:hypothetical protein
LTMTDTQHVAHEDINKLISLGQRVYDPDGNKVGTIARYDTQTAWMKVEKGTLFHRDLYIPFSTISTIDPREIALSVVLDDLLASYTNPPSRTTHVAQTAPNASGCADHVAVSTVPSGYDGTPLQVGVANIDELNRQLADGMRVYDDAGRRVGMIDRYDSARGYMRIAKHTFLPRDLYIPTTLVDSVDLDADDVHLAVPRELLDRLYVEASSGTSFAENTVIPSNLDEAVKMSEQG